MNTGNRQTFVAEKIGASRAKNIVKELLEFCNSSNLISSQQRNTTLLNFSETNNFYFDKPLSKFHVHVDANNIGSTLEKEMIDIGYQNSDFIKHDGGQPEPRYIRTLKFDDPKKYKMAMDEIHEKCKANPEFVGFVEGEVIVGRCNIPYSNFIESIAVPFVVDTRFEPGGYSKDSDMHVTLCPLRSHPKLLESLIGMGFSCVLAPKPWGLMAVFSLQGSQKIIASLYEKTCEYLMLTGGAVECNVKDERISFLWLSGDDAPKTRIVTNVDWSF